ncbi:baseplate J/gp47 family protein [Pseudomonas granadensis]|uniref:baseplate J/gp47 family protein n=1 Tax=Pseudomonas granadensis TaxID=1421430 RepID=UPI0019D270A2|nr:baseplate J/gp47 family protein [Pseudomonas granadensis]MBN6805002.1 baseplate J/gp47 family protein [Pseudomonas granadensis]MBN6832148.1 baseplate J/gp47 family protein [Pseudomonas granadensis]MBN6838773.1 baseplate J/gp47 family protein [Pseudomonas granadensis]MBN6867110.1 baseplate J/gp47 family protein [Pseudomonas granadensis]
MSQVDFKKVIADAGIPTTEAGLKAAWEKEVEAQGAKVANTSSYSPFWRVMTALVTKPVLWLLDFLCLTVLPNFFVKTAVDAWLDMLAWAVNVERKGATKARGKLLFTRALPDGVMELEKGIVVQSAAINGNVYKLITTAPATFVAGQLQLEVPVEAIESGSGFNLAPGYYAILPVPVPGIVQVVNKDGWLESPGADPEPNNQLRLRVRNQFSAVNQWHTDAVYRAMISAFPGVRPDGVYFEHGAPRGPGSANAFVLFDAGVPAATYLEQINSHIRDQGNHGHGDDLLAMVMPEVPVSVAMTLWPQPNLSAEQIETLKSEIELFIRAAFRESTPRDYQPTLTYPQSRFSFSRLAEELHQRFADIASLRFTPGVDITSGLDIPRLTSLKVNVQ